MTQGIRLLALLAANGIAAFAVLWANGRTWDTTPIALDREPNIMLDDPDPAMLGKRGETIDRFAIANAVSRPLFSHTRRAWRPPPPKKELPPKQVAAANTPAPMAKVKPDFELIGVSITQDAFSALLRKTDTRESAWVGQGAEIWEWVVVAISDDKVVVAKSGQQAELALYPEMLPAIR